MTTRVPIELSASIKTRAKASSAHWKARTIEIGRDELWLSCESAEGSELPRREDLLVVTIDLPINESAGRRCMECDVELVGIEIVDASTVRLRMRVVTMKIRERKPNASAAKAPKLVM